MRRATTFLVTIFLMAAAIPAQADQPLRVLPGEDTQQSFVDGRCGFDMLVEVSGKEGYITFDDYERWIFPQTTGVVTNLDTGESHSLDLSGPGKFSVTPTPDGGSIVVLIGTGNWLHGQEEDIFSTSGRFVATFVVDAQGNLVSEDLDLSKARVLSMCELLTS